MKRMTVLLVSALVATALFTGCASTESVQSTSSPAKREFRGAWIQTVNGQFMGMSTNEIKKTLSYQLDELWKDGVNAIIFQVGALEQVPDRATRGGAKPLLGPIAVDD